MYDAGGKKSNKTQKLVRVWDRPIIFYQGTLDLNKYDNICKTIENMSTHQGKTCENDLVSLHSILLGCWRSGFR